MARICVDLALPHLDRPFDYLVPASMDAKVVVGGRVRVRFAGQKVDGYVLDRVAASEHGGSLSFLERAVSAEPVVSPEIARLARAVADRYAGNLADVLRLAVPPRHARAEAAVPPRQARWEAVVPTGDVPAETEVPTRAGGVSGSGGKPGEGSEVSGDGDGGGPPGRPAFPATVGWAAYPAGAAFLRALADGRAPRAVWTATPGEDWAARVAEAVGATLSGGRGAVVVVPDGRDLHRLDRALLSLLGEGRHVALSAATGPEERYTRFVTALRGHVGAVIGTRAAMFAPVDDLGLVAIFDDGDDVHADPHAPYPHAREVLLTRAELAGAAALVAGHSRTAEGQLLLATGWAKELTADRESLRTRAPRVVTTGDDVQQSRDPGAVSSRLPSVALQAARVSLAAGRPVLVQVPRRGYIPAVACETCRAPARCPHCSGPLALESGVLGGNAGVAGASPEHSGPSCRWCGRGATGFTCPVCGGRRLRASVVGARRTADEMGRAFAGVPVRTSGRGELLDTVPDGPALVVATPGAEPVADAGYGAVLLLDTWALLTRADLRAGEEALRRWLSAAALARADGTVVIVADASVPVVQALVRFDPAWYAARELDERAELGFPPAVRVGSLTGSPAAIAELLAGARMPAGVDELGPVPVFGGDEGVERLLLRVPRSTGPALARALHEAAGVRSAHRAKEPVRVQIDPLELL
ncbi:primosomal protein N' [Longispora fulva]|uniref:primosomal protein N' n=1 Tax=Longispora fulva TaxID=619741 RepID=UPI002279136B|nr:primosomal protein N' [Longispora fulva]